MISNMFDDIGKEFWERIKEFIICHDWFLTENSNVYDELEKACLQGASVEDIATIVWCGSLDDDGNPVVERQKVMNAVSYVKTELDEQITRADQTVRVPMIWNDQRIQMSLFVSGYFETNHLRIAMMEIFNPRYQTYCDLTTEFADPNLGMNEAYIFEAEDIDFLENCGLAKRAASTTGAGEYIDSFGCSYYKMEFDMEKLAAYDPIGVERYRKLHEERNELKKEETAAAEKAPADISEEQNVRTPLKHRR